MKILLFLLAILTFMAGASILAVAKSAIHEIEAFILFLISAVFISGASVVEAVNLLRKEVATDKKQARNSQVRTLLSGELGAGVPESSEEYKLSHSEAAQAIGVTGGTLQGYIKSGRIHVNPDDCSDPKKLDHFRVFLTS